jgi:hypothetical protein
MSKRQVARESGVDSEGAILKPTGTKVASAGPGAGSSGGTARELTPCRSMLESCAGEVACKESNPWAYRRIAQYE